jgi:hypothetical protein
MKKKRDRTGEYQLRKDYHRNRHARLRREIALFLRAYKAENPCTDCGNHFPEYVMEFDHVPERGKAQSLISAVVSWVTLDREMEKCDLVCANCHKVRSHVRGQFNRKNYEKD